MLRILGLSCLAAILGVVTATSSTCGVGLASGTDTWCGLQWVWLVGFPTAIAFALVVGFPAALLYRKLGLTRWWQFLAGGALIATPYWFAMAEPFTSVRWQQSGFFDSLNYLGSGALAGIWFWWLSHRAPSNPAVKRDAPQAARPLP